MKRYNLYIILTAFLAVGLSSCDKFLDEKPDNRMDLHSKEDLSRLLVDAYPIISPAYILEMRSDNTNEYHNTAWASQGRFQEQAYNWETMTDVSANDNARYLWDSNYHAIAAANEVIKFVKGKAVGEQAQFDAQLGEALLCRAYCMFVLANTFCMAYDEATASQELGLPYPLEPESVVGVTYERGTLAELYQKIDNDLQEGLAIRRSSTSPSRPAMPLQPVSTSTIVSTRRPRTMPTWCWAMPPQLSCVTGHIWPTCRLTPMSRVWSISVRRALPTCC